jgi:hypothetical protein
MRYEARQPNTLKSGFFSLRKIPVNTVFRVSSPPRKKAPNHQQELKITLKTAPDSFSLTLLLKGHFLGTGYTMGSQGIQPPDAAMTIVFHHRDKRDACILFRVFAGIQGEMGCFHG